MAEREHVTGYARALFEIVRAEGALDRVSDELYGFAATVEQNAELRDALTDPSLPAENRKRVVGDLLGERAHPLSAALIGLVVDAGRARDLGHIVQGLATVAAAEREHALAEVRVAVALSDAQRERLAAALSEVTGRTVEVRVVVDPSVVGGVVARVGNEVFDGSVASRLEDARQHLGASR